jgi:hypothetical protein
MSLTEEFNPEHIYGNAVECTLGYLPLVLAEILVRDAKRHVPSEYWSYVKIGEFKDLDRGFVGYQWKYEPADKMTV